YRLIIEFRKEFFHKKVNINNKLFTKQRVRAMADTSSPYDTIKATAVRFMDSYNAAFSQRDVSLLSSTLTPDCARSVAPASFLPSLGVNNVSLQTPSTKRSSRPSCRRWRRHAFKWRVWRSTLSK